MRKVLWLMPPYEPTSGGPYTSVIEELHGFQTEELSILTFGTTDPVINEIVEYMNFENLEFKSKRNTLYGLARITKHGIHAISRASTIRVDGFYGLPLLYALFFCSWQCRIEVVPHGAIGQPTRKSRLTKSFFRRIVKLLIRFKKSSVSFLAFSNLEKSKIELLFPGLKVGVRARKIEFLVDEDGIREMSFAYLGRLSPEKGILEVIQLYASFRKVNDRYKLIIAGSGEDVFTRKLQDKCVELGLCDSVIFLGWLNSIEKSSLLSKTSGLICLSPFESLGLSVLEAIQYKVPIFTTEGVGASEFVEKLGVGLVSASKESVISDFMYFELNLDRFKANYMQLGREKTLELIPECSQYL